jgi:hypothetical protein
MLCRSGARKSRIDAPGALHHINLPGELKEGEYLKPMRIGTILSRFCDILTETKTACYVWALIPKEIVRARSLLCYWAVRKLGVTMTSLSRRLNISLQTIGKSVIRGEKLTKAK